ncbi:MAG TPA: ATP-binding protein [Polyangiaceae bacterium]|nr:ATP-binding protein [Polyangiaceae bacterium]
MAGPSRHQLEDAAEPEVAPAEPRFGEGLSGPAPKHSGQFSILDRLRSILQHSPDPIYELDGEGIIRFASKVATGQPRDVVGQSFYDLIAPRFRTSARNVVEAAMKSGEPATVEVLANGSAEDASWLSCRIGPLAESDGAIITVRDTTGRRQSEAQLVATDRLASVGTLAAGVAHEINNPLAAVIANLELAVADLQAMGVGGEILEEVKDAREAAERVRLIVRDLRLFSRTEEPRRGPVDVREVLDSTLRMAWHEIRHRARLVKAFDEVPPVEANEARLGQVFLNLVINAAHAIPEGRAEANLIHVATRTQGERVVVEISDTGVGMSSELLEHIFTPFFSTRPAGIGTGLGLTICRRLVEDIGGELRVTSREGKGSTFTILVPQTERTADERLSSAPPAVTGTPRRGRILVVDDDPMVAAAVRRSLMPDHEVVTTTVTEEALRLLRNGERFEVILCDVMMPNMTGMDFFQELDRFAPAETPKIVFLTGGAFAPHARQFLDSVPNLSIDKPFLPEKLRKIVRERLEQKRPEG